MTIKTEKRDGRTDGNASDGRVDNAKTIPHSTAQFDYRTGINV